MNKYLDLYLTWAKIGAFTFGGGYSMLPIIQKEVVENKKWATEEEIIDYYFGKLSLNDIKDWLNGLIK